MRLPLSSNKYVKSQNQSIMLNRCLFVGLMFCSLTLKAQSNAVLQDNFEGLTWMNNWNMANCRWDTTVRPRNGHIVLGSNGFLQTRKSIPSAGTLRFWTASPQIFDNFVLIIETSPNGFTDWQTIQDGELNYTTAPETSTEIVFRPIVRQLNIVGPLFLRFRFKSYVVGDFRIDDFTIDPISEEARKALEAKREEEKFRQSFEVMIKDFDARSKSSSFVSNMSRTKQIYLRRLETLKALNEKSAAITIIAGTASALAVRNEMANPMDYNDFKNRVEELKTYLDETNKLFLDDLVGSIRKPFEKFSSIARIGGNLMGVIGNVVTGGRLEVFINSFKSLSAQAYSRANLTQLATSGALNLSRRADIDKYVGDNIRKGADFYRSTRDFLDIIAEEHEKALSLNSAINNIFRDAAILNSEIQDLMRDYLSAVNINHDPDLIRKFFKNDNDARNQLRKGAENFFDEIVSARNTDTEATKRSLEKVEASLKKIDLLIDRYGQVATGLSGFYHAFEEDLKRINPFEGKAGFAESVKTWQEKRNQAQSTLEKVQQVFKDTFVNYYFY
jgi:hypothetical protein